MTGWNASGSTGTFDIENRTAFGNKGIVITGELTAIDAAVPEPATPGLLGFGLAGLGWSRRKKA